MKGYLSIGAVAKRKGVSIKSLRYYDQIGVLHPAYINEKTNYRYYTEEQLYLLDAVSLCIELGIPLRDFGKYRDDHGNFNLQALLYDGKLLAEQKIMDIRKRLGTVQAALQALDYKPVRMQPHTEAPATQTHADKPEAPAAQTDADKPKAWTAQTDADKSGAQTTQPDPKDGFYQRCIPKRAVLTMPYTDEDGANYSQKILRLFMLAQLLGMTASYPSGILYEYGADGTVRKHIFIQVENYADCTDKRLHFLPEGSYFCKQGKEHGIVSPDALINMFRLSGKSFIVAESDLIDDDLKQGDNSLELQLLQTS